MKHLFLPYELALIAKEKGFDKPCLSYFQPNIEGLINQFFVSRDQPEIYEDNYNIITLAPLYQQIIDWLREEHLLHITILPDKFTDRNEGKLIYNIIFSLDDPSYSWNLIRKTPREGELIVESVNYYEALYKGIEQAFKLI